MRGALNAIDQIDTRISRVNQDVRGKMATVMQSAAHLVRVRLAQDTSDDRGEYYPSLVSDLPAGTVGMWLPALAGKALFVPLGALSAAAPLVGAGYRDSVSYGGAGTTLGAPTVTFSSLDSSRTYRVKAWLTLAVTPTSGQTASAAVVIAGTQGPLKAAANNGVGAAFTADVSAVTSVTVAVHVETSDATAVTWSAIRLQVEAQLLG